MAEPFIAEIKIIGFNFAPRGWAFCDGQLLPVSQYTALFAILGATYGGDGRSTFALPDLQGRAPMHPGNGPGLTERKLGQRGGVEAVGLTGAQLPPHTHRLIASALTADDDSPESRAPARTVPGRAVYHPANGPTTSMASAGIPNPGVVSHNNMQPFLALHFVIAMTGSLP